MKQVNEAKWYIFVELSEKRFRNLILIFFESGDVVCIMPSGEDRKLKAVD